jgi:hypothetical protein
MAASRSTTGLGLCRFYWNYGKATGGKQEYSDMSIGRGGFGDRSSAGVTTVIT